MRDEGWTDWWTLTLLRGLSLMNDVVGADCRPHVAVAASVVVVVVVVVDDNELRDGIE